MPIALALKVIEFPILDKGGTKMARTICPECYEGIHSQCIGQGCYCECQIPHDPPIEVECPHGFIRSMCEICEQEEQ
jgi:hypothetical protein